MGSTTDQFAEGQHVVVTQQIPLVRGVWTTQVEGEVVRYEQRKTGSWFAHAKDDRLWLDRLVIRKTDGELVTLNLDGYTHIEVVESPPDATPGEPQPEPGGEIETFPEEAEQ